MNVPSRYRIILVAIIIAFVMIDVSIASSGPGTSGGEANQDAGNGEIANQNAGNSGIANQNAGNSGIANQNAGNSGIANQNTSYQVSVSGMVVDSLICSINGDCPKS
jgi:hypothetical protein